MRASPARKWSLTRGRLLAAGQGFEGAERLHRLEQGLAVLSNHIQKKFQKVAKIATFFRRKFVLSNAITSTSVGHRSRLRLPALSQKKRLEYTTRTRMIRGVSAIHTYTSACLRSVFLQPRSLISLHIASGTRLLAGWPAESEIIKPLHEPVENIRQICQNMPKSPSNFPKFQSKFRTVPSTCRTGCLPSP